jgi:cardiolipin synthase
MNMLSSQKLAPFKWLATGDENFPALFEAIDSATQSVRFETYIYSNDHLGQECRAALVRARQRGLKVQVLLDSIGSWMLTQGFWEPLVSAGGEVHWFNPISLHRLAFRNHRKMLVCDDKVAFVGGFNISDEYKGDGVHSGWCDLGLRITGPLVKELADAFDESFGRADFKHKRFARLRRTSAKRKLATRQGDLFLSGPGRGRNPFQRALHKDLTGAKNVQIISAYFLPNRRLRRDLKRIARAGGCVQLILAGKSDVYLSQLAGRSLYQRLLRAGVEIYEYQPQILHTKLIVVDGAVYAGSSNLDPRSLYINYELTLRLTDQKLVAEAREIFRQKLAHCARIEAKAWKKSSTWWGRLKRRWAYFLLVRIDPLIARWQYRRMPD